MSQSLSQMLPDAQGPAHELVPAMGHRDDTADTVHTSNTNNTI
ncbi:hypothetical protein LJR078_003613 [Arthrobacter sp. LjRoot78]